MGADYIDYLITDEIASPKHTLDSLYTEKVIYMPFSYFVNDYKQSCKYVLNAND
jgi:protein O-GlcNAc transferase